MINCSVKCRKPSVSFWLILVIASAFVSLGGCSQESSAPRYQVSGTVTYDGQPVPAGLVKFQPDVDKGGTGPGGYAPIKEGKFCTKEGLCAGPVKVSICGFDGELPDDLEASEAIMEESHLFGEYPALAVIKNEDTVLDFAVPLIPQE